MSKKKILICEDNVFISEQLRAILSDLGYEVMEIGTDASSAIRIMETDLPDLAILDIKMHGKNDGFEIADYIRKNHTIPFIFLTSLADVSTVNEAAAYHPAAYLVKPFNEQHIFSTLEIVLTNFEKQSQYLTIKKSEFLIRVLYSDICWVKADDKYIEIVTPQKKHIKRISLNAFIEEYKVPGLIRVHRSYLVKKDRIEAITRNSVVVLGEEIPLSRKYSSEVREFFQ